MFSSCERHNPDFSYSQLRCIYKPYKYPYKDGRNTQVPFVFCTLNLSVQLHNFTTCVLKCYWKKKNCVILYFFLRVECVNKLLGRVRSDAGAADICLLKGALKKLIMIA